MDEKYFDTLLLVFDSDEAKKINETLCFNDQPLIQIGMFIENHPISKIQLDSGTLDDRINNKAGIDILLSKEAKLYIRKTFINFNYFDSELKGLQRLQTHFLSVPEVFSYNDSELSIVKEFIPGTNLFLFVKSNPRNTFLYLTIVKLFLEFCMFYIRQVTIVDYTPANIVVHSLTKKLYIIDLESFEEYPSLFNYNLLKRTGYGTVKYVKRFGRLIPRAGRYMHLKAQ